MSYNIDGFNERNTFIRNSNDMNKISNNHNHFDNSFAKMRSEERRNLVTTANSNNISKPIDTRGNKDNFVILNNRINNLNNRFKKSN